MGKMKGLSVWLPELTPRKSGITEITDLTIELGYTFQHSDSTWHTQEEDNFFGINRVGNITYATLSSALVWANTK